MVAGGKGGSGSPSHTPTLRGARNLACKARDRTEAPVSLIRQSVMPMWPTGASRVARPASDAPRRTLNARRSKRPRARLRFQTFSSSLCATRRSSDGRLADSEGVPSMSDPDIAKVTGVEDDMAWGSIGRGSATATRSSTPWRGDEDLSPGARLQALPRSGHSEQLLVRRRADRDRRAGASLAA
jgi:hypothetical protein